MASHLMDTYQRLPVSFTHGDGVWLFDDDGKRYLDALCGISVTSLGHNHPAVTAAIHEQAGKLLHTSNLYQIQAQQKLADRLCEVSGLANVFFSNSGAEANEAAIKLARRHASGRGIQAPLIISFDGSFHGRTLATLTATGNPKVKQGFAPLPEGFVQLPFNDLEALEACFSTHTNIAAVLVEPIQGEGGINPAQDDFLQRIQQLCASAGALFMLDEIQTGNGRCGNYFAFQGLDLQPDVVTTAKALGNGVPIGACLANTAAAQALTPGSHGSTFGGNPLACAAALAVVETIVDQGLDARAAALGKALAELLGEQLADCSAVVAIRQRGLMLGIELDRPCSELVSQALQQQLLINVTAERVIRLLPPLVADMQHIEQIAATVAGLVLNFVNGA